MLDLTIDKTCALLNSIMECELAGVVRYALLLMVSGPYRIPIVQFMKAQANESLVHAQQVGEILTGLNGHPTQKIEPIEESNQHSIKAILQESIEHELRALNLYKEILTEVENAIIYL